MKKNNFKVYNNKGEEISKEQFLNHESISLEEKEAMNKEFQNVLNKWIVKNGGEILE
jgi:hypothetical protein